MTRTHEIIVDDQFGAQASAYVESAVHAEGEDLAKLATIASANSRIGPSISDRRAAMWHTGWRPMPAW